MKIIHTADWHLGKILNGKSLLEDQEYILKQFVEEMKEEQPEVIVIAGDLYDTSYPNKDAVKLLEQTIAELNLELNIPLIITNGNHDGKARLNYGAEWFSKSNLHIRTSLEDIKDPIIINDVNFYTLPFATLAEIKDFLNDDEIQTYQQGVTQLINLMTEDLNSNEINILIGHLTVQGGIRSDSEREITIGTVEEVNERYFESFDRVLLGHLHHPFSINSEYIQYSGSLLQYSFSEVNQSKGYRIISIKNNEIKGYFKKLDPQRELEIVTGDYEDVVQERLFVKNKDNYMQFRLSHMSHVTDPMSILKNIFPNTLSLINNQMNEQLNQFEVDHTMHQKSDFEIINEFYRYVTDQSLSDNQSKIITDVLEEIDKGEY